MRFWITIGFAAIGIAALVALMVLDSGNGDVRLAGPLFGVYIVCAIAYNIGRHVFRGFDGVGDGDGGDNDCDGDGGD